MPRILFGVSSIGLGHATRALVLVRELERRGAEVRIFSGGKAADFMTSCGAKVDDIVDDPVPRVAEGEMKQASLWYLRSWYANRKTVRRTERLFDAYPHDLVVCDEEFSGMVVAERRGEKRVFISDELELGFARSWLARLIERRVERWYRRLQGSVDLLIVPEDGQDHGNTRFVGPIVRAQTMSSEETRRLHGVSGGKMILVSISGSGIGGELASRLVSDLRAAGVDDQLVITGNRGRRITGDGVHDLGVVIDNQNIVASADVVVSSAGKSTIDEASAAGTPIVVVPIRHHAEQERNAAALGYGRDRGILLEEVLAKRGIRSEPRSYHGEVRAAGLILSLLSATGRP